MNTSTASQNMTSPPVALITGAGRGIGRATAIELASRGYRLALLARTKVDLEETAAQAKSAYVPSQPGHTFDAKLLTCDVGHRQALIEAVGDAATHFGRVDVLVSNAGLAPLAGFETFTHDALDDILDVNLASAVHAARAVWPLMQRQKSGALVFVASMAAKDPFPGLAAYAAAKAGLVALTTALAKEGAAHAIRAHCVAPGAVETGMFRALMTEQQYPASNTLRPQEVAKVIADFACGSLAGCTSGQTLYLTKTPR